VGTWSDGGDYFRLSPDGVVDLEIDGPEASLLIREGSLRSFEGPNLEVGVGEWQPSEHLTISESPYSAPKGDAIRVEGIELFREQTPVRPAG